MRIKSIKSTKSTKRQTSDFLPLRCFYAHKNAVFFVSHTKKHKKHKNHKDTNKRTSDFPHLRCFLCSYRCCLFCFCSLVYVFVLFVRVKSFCKKIKRFKSVLIPSFSILVKGHVLDTTKTVAFYSLLSKYHLLLLFLMCFRQTFTQ